MSSEVQFSVLSSNVWNPAISSVCVRSLSWLVHGMFTLSSQPLNMNFTQRRTRDADSLVNNIRACNESHTSPHRQGCTQN